MNSLTKLSFLIITFLFVFITSCKKDQQYSIIPNIAFQSFERLEDARGVDTTLILTLSFTDGDGDIGLAPGDTVSPYSGVYKNDLFVNYYERQNGKLVYVYKNPSFNSRLPLVTVNGKNKNIKGTIQVNLSFGSAGLISKFDTIAFQVYIVDRAFHKSNIIMTPEIAVKK